MTMTVCEFIFRLFLTGKSGPLKPKGKQKTGTLARNMKHLPWRNIYFPGTQITKCEEERMGIHLPFFPADESGTLKPKCKQKQAHSLAIWNSSIRETSILLVPKLRNFTTTVGEFIFRFSGGRIWWSQTKRETKNRHPYQHYNHVSTRNIYSPQPEITKYT